jgi:hypothetical protein
MELAAAQAACMPSVVASASTNLQPFATNVLETKWFVFVFFEKVENGNMLHLNRQLPIKLNLHTGPGFSIFN